MEDTREKIAPELVGSKKVHRAGRQEAVAQYHPGRIVG
jgi:hypothetical protein